MPIPSKTTTAAIIGLDVPAGSIYADNGALQTDGAGNVTATSINSQQLALLMGIAAPVVIVTAGTVVIPAGTSTVRLAPAAAVTGIIMPAGTRNGQIITIINTSAVANTITFAAAGTSLVAGGLAISLQGVAAHMLQWDSVGLLWYQVGPAAN